jgi:site-specific DNA-methyltransferase (adenine-specific)
MNIELYNDDCMNVLDTIDKKIDLALFDLPYGDTHCQWDNKIDLSLMWQKLKKISKPNTCFIFFGSMKFGNELINSNPKWFRYDLVWSKPNSSAGFLNAKKMPLRSHEMIYVFYEKLPTYNVKEYHKVSIFNTPQQVISDIYGKTKVHQGTYYEPRLPKSILEFDTTNKKKGRNHPTEKPVDLLKWLMRYYSNEGDVVLDITMGSGSTGVAARELNRYFIGIEMDKKYYDVACERILKCEEKLLEDCNANV